MSRRRFALIVLAGLALALPLRYAAHFIAHNWASTQPQDLTYRDFFVFHSAGRLAAQGEAAAAYDPVRLKAAVAEVAPELASYSWSYPPTLFLLLAPLSALSIGLAVKLWLIGPLVLLAFIAWRIEPQLWAPVAAALFPAAVHGALTGNTGALLAVLIGGGLWLLARHPGAAGALLGLAAIKPHLAVLVPICLLAGREWRATLSFILTAGLVLLASLATFGLSPWLAMAGNLSGHWAILERSVLEGIGPTWERLPTVYVGVLTLTGEPALAALMQVFVALIALGLAAAIWWRSDEASWRAIAMVSAALLATPYAFDYDLALYAVPFVLLAAQAWRRGRATMAEWIALGLMWLGPLIAVAVSAELGVQVGWLAPMVLLAWTLSNAYAMAAMQPSHPVTGAPD